MNRGNILQWISIPILLAGVGIGTRGCSSLDESTIHPKFDNRILRAEGVLENGVENSRNAIVGLERAVEVYKTLGVQGQVSKLIERQRELEETYASALENIRATPSYKAVIDAENNWDKNYRLGMALVFAGFVGFSIGCHYEGRRINVRGN
ncbi:MAG: hypothetical protein AABW89_06165 [Nanoarchaeota archaeon]